MSDGCQKDSLIESHSYFIIDATQVVKNTRVTNLTNFNAKSLTRVEALLERGGICQKASVSNI